MDQPLIPASSLIDPDDLQTRLQTLRQVQRPRYGRLWSYYANPMRVTGQVCNGSDRPYRQGQEWGLPTRITGRGGRADESGQTARKEIVIENDIAWRVETSVDYLFGQTVSIASDSPDPDRRAVITELLRRIIEHNGGIRFLQQLSLLGAIYGFIDVLVKLETPPDPSASSDPASASSPDSTLQTPDPGATVIRSLDPALERIARMVRLEIVEPARAVPILSPRDWREVIGYVQHYELPRPRVAPRRQNNAGWLDRLRTAGRESPDRRPTTIPVIEIITPDRWQRIEDGRIVAMGINSLGRIPLVHMQNTAVPFAYEGNSDVEALIPLQDELNTRLSDRANRIALQSFKMYLGKRINDFASLPVGPGRMWSTDDDQAQVQEFGGDAHCPSEESHLTDLREAMDKTSGVSPIAAGAIKGRIGRLTSAAALRITLLSLLARTERKRTTYGAAIEAMCELSLAWLDHAGLFPNTPSERRIELNWPSPLPQNDVEKLEEAEIKQRLGIPREVVLQELGYGS